MNVFICQCNIGIKCVVCIIYILYVRLFETLVVVANLLALYCVISGIDLVHIMCDDNIPLLLYICIYIRIHHCMSVVLLSLFVRVIDRTEKC